MKPTSSNVNTDKYDDTYFEQINRITRFFKREGFGFLFATADNFHLRQQVNQQVKNKLTENAIQIVEMALDEDENALSIIQQLKNILKEQLEIKGIIINNLDYYIKDNPDKLQAFNFSRELLADLEIPILFWMNEMDMPDFTRRASDIYTWRSLSVIRFPNLPVETPSRSMLLQRFDENFRTKEEYKQLELKIKLLESQLKEAEAKNYPVQRRIDEIVYPLFTALRDADLHDRKNELYKRYEDDLSDDKLKNLLIKSNYSEDNKEYTDSINYELMILDLANNELEIANSYNRIGRIFYLNNEYEKSIEYIQNCIDKLEKSFPEQNNIISVAYNNIASSYEDLKERNAAEKSLIKAIEYKLKIKEQDSSLAISYNNLGANYLYQGKLDKALTYLMKSVKIYEDFYDNKSPQLGVLFHNLAGIYFEKRQFKEAYNFGEKAVDIIKFYPDHINYDTIHHNYQIFKDALVHIPYKNTIRVRRNDLCPCKSGKKYKKCCGK